MHYKTGASPRWVIGPVAGNENGWGFVDTVATRPDKVGSENWMVWSDSSWDVSKKLAFQAHQSKKRSGGGGKGSASEEPSPLPAAGGQGAAQGAAQDVQDVQDWRIPKEEDWRIGDRIGGQQQRGRDRVTFGGVGEQRMQANAAQPSPAPLPPPSQIAVATEASEGALLPHALPHPSS